MTRLTATLIALASAPLLLAACATGPVAYEPSSGASTGFADQRIETGRYQVSFTARDRATAERYALRRAAELTIAEGGEWFEVTSSYTDSEGNPSGPSTSVGVGVGGSSRGRVSTGVGVGISLPVSGGTKVTHSISILVGSGPQPDSARTYSAEDVLMTTLPGQ